MSVNGSNPGSRPHHLGHVKRGFKGHVVAIEAHHGGNNGLEPPELERRLIEMGFLEGAAVEVLHEGAIGKDPIAVRIDGHTFALRRREAMAVLVQ